MSTKIEWRPMKTAPEDQRQIQCKTKDGMVHPDVHFAHDLSGEDQPAFSGHFIPVLNSEGALSYYSEIYPVAWYPAFDKDGKEITK